MLKMNNKKIAVIGGGSWGTALSLHLAEKFEQVNLWVFEKELCNIILKERENKWFLPGILLPQNISPDNSIKKVIHDQTVIVLVVPTPKIRDITKQLKPFVNSETLIINGSKGIENDTLIPCHKIIEDNLNIQCKIATISGPTFAKEVANKMPSALLAASDSTDTAKIIQKMFSSNNMKVFTSTDIMGVEIGGALKNVIAIATGICDGLKLGFNTRAALITRGLVEIARIGTELGAKPETFYGLSGLGDLVLTCTGDLSRNRQLGLAIGRGLTVDQAVSEVGKTVEGMHAAREVLQRAQQLGVEMPIVEQVYKILFEGNDPRESVQALLCREQKAENSHPAQQQIN